MPEARRSLLEKLLRDGETTERVGQSFRIDYDVIDEHVQSHMQPPQSHEERIDSLLTEFSDMIETARNLVETENDAENLNAYANMVTKYHDMSRKEWDRKQKAHADALEADVLVGTLIERVLNPMLTETTKIVIGEISRLRDELRKMGGLNDTVVAQFDDTTRRLGTQIQGVAANASDSVKSCIVGNKPEKKPKR